MFHLNCPISSYFFAFFSSNLCHHLNGEYLAMPIYFMIFCNKRSSSFKYYLPSWWLVIFNCASCLLWFKGFTISLETSLNSMCSPYSSFLALLPRLARTAVLPFCLFASPPPSLPLYLSLECRCLVKITLAMPCYVNDYQLSTCLPLLLQQLPIQTCQKKYLSCIIN